MNRDEFRLVIGVPFDRVNMRYLELDTCTSKQVSSSARIASAPVQSGLYISDHMYREPDAFSVSGHFSLNGKNGSAFAENPSLDSFSSVNILNGIDIENSSYDYGDLTSLSLTDRLGNIQKVFEYIKNNGLRCQLITISGDPQGSNVSRFKIRNNMALESITWVEGYNSINYTFNFKEIMSITNQIYETYEDGLYPDTGMPSAKTIGEVIQDNGTIYQTVINFLLEQGYIAERDGVAAYYRGNNLVSDTSSILNQNFRASTGMFWTYAGIGTLITAIGAGLTYVGLGAYGVATAAAVAAGGATIGMAAGAIGAIGLTATGVGAIVVAAAILVTGIAVAISNYIKSEKKRKNLEKGINLILNYKNYITEKAPYEIKEGIDIDSANFNQEGLTKLKVLLDDVQNAIDNEFSGITIYPLSSSENDNDSKTFAIMIGSDACYFTVEKQEDGSTQPYSIQIMDGSGKNASTRTVLNKWAPVTDLTACSRYTNSVYIDSSREYECYLFAPSLSEDICSSEEYDEKSKYLMNYSLIVCQGTMKEKMNNLGKIITDAIESSVASW